LKDLDETGKFFEEIENHWEIKVEAVEVRNAELHPEYQKAAAVEQLQLNEKKSWRQRAAQKGFWGP
jgi:regulator of protease activity HflC (stomatin/prohibitin superfamily)